MRQAIALLDVIADDFLPMSDLIARRMPELLAAAPAQTARVRERVRGNLTYLKHLLAQDELGVTDVLHAEGGWNVLLRFPTAVDESDLVLRLIREHQASAQPGFFFDMTSNGYVAVSLLPEPDAFAHGVELLLSAIREELSC